MNPCKDWCFARFGKEYTKECDALRLCKTSC